MYSHFALFAFADVGAGHRLPSSYSYGALRGGGLQTITTVSDQLCAAPDAAPCGRTMRPSPAPTPQPTEAPAPADGAERRGPPPVAAAAPSHEASPPEDLAAHIARDAALFRELGWQGFGE